MQQLMDPENIPLCEMRKEFLMDLRKYVYDSYKAEDFLIACDEDVAYLKTGLHKFVNLGEGNVIYKLTSADREWLFNINQVCFFLSEFSNNFPIFETIFSICF